MNRILRSLAGAMQHEDFDPLAIFDFMDALYAAAGRDRARAHQLHSVLTNLGSVCRTLPNGIAPQAIIDCLIERGILERVRVRHSSNGSPPKYALVRRYAAMRRVLLATRSRRSCPPALTRDRAVAKVA